MDTLVKVGNWRSGDVVAWAGACTDAGYDGIGRGSELRLQLLRLWLVGGFMALRDFGFRVSGCSGFGFKVSG